MLILGSTIFSNHYGCAFSLFQGKSDLTEVELTSAEMAQVEILEDYITNITIWFVNGALDISLIILNPAFSARKEIPPLDI